MFDSVNPARPRFDLSAFMAAHRKFCRTGSGEDLVARLIVGMRRHGVTPTNFLEGDAENEKQGISDSRH